MSDYAKYIIVEIEVEGKDNVETAILFENFIEHKIVAKPYKKVLSAGFFAEVVENQDVDVAVFGMSTSLQLGTRMVDPLVIKRILQGKI